MSRKISKKFGISYDHPMAKIGFIHESWVREAFPIANDTYFREWCRKNRIPNRVIGGERWFHSESLIAWFVMSPNEDDGDGADPSPYRAVEP